MGDSRFPSQRAYEPRERPILGRVVLAWFFMLGMIVVLISLHTYYNYRQFEARQKANLASALNSVGNTLNQLLDDNQNALNVFAESEAYRLSQLLDNRDNHKLFAQLHTDLIRQIPQTKGLAISDFRETLKLSQTLQSQQTIIKQQLEYIASHGHQQSLMLNPDNSTYMLISFWLGKQSNRSLVLASFSTEPLRTELNRHQHPGYLFALTSNDVSEKIQIHDIELSESDLNTLPIIHDYQSPLIGNHWRLIAVKDTEFFHQILLENIESAALLGTGFIIASLPIFVFFYRQERRQRNIQMLLQRSETRFRRFFENASDPLLIIDQEADRVIDANLQAAKLLGYKQTTLVGQSWRRLYAKTETLDHLLNNIQKEGSAWSDQIICRTANGQNLAVEISASFIRQDNAGLLIWRMRNIDERKRATLALQALAESAADSSNEDFIRACIRRLVEIYDCTYGFIGLQQQHDPSKIKISAFWDGKSFVEEMSYTLADTPCETLINGQLKAVNENIQTHYPAATMLKKLQVSGYFGVPLRNSHQQVIGLLTIMSTQPLVPDNHMQSVIEIYANRLALEIEQQQAHKTLIESESNYRDLIEGSIQATIIHRNWQPLYVNPACVAMFAYSTRAEMLELPSLTVLFPEHEHPRLQRYFAIPAIDEDVPHQYELNGLRKDGAFLTLENLSRHITWHGEPATQTILIDLSARKHAENELVNNQKRFQQFASASADWFWETDTEMRFINIFGNFEALTGYPATSIIGKYIFDAHSDMIIDHNDSLNYRDVMRNQQAFKNLRLDWRRPDDTILKLRCSGLPVFDSKQNFMGFRGAIHDASKEISAREELIKYQTSLEQLVAERSQELEVTQKKLLQKERLATIGRLVATVSHELRNPLGAVRNAAYYLKRKIPSSETRWREYLDIIDKEVNAADKIIADLLETTRAKLPVIQEIDLEALILHVLANCTANTKIQYSYHSTPEHMFVTADRDHLRQVLLNLITNATHAINGTGNITVIAEQTETESVIHIQDNGPGVEFELRESIFEPLFTTKSKGNGLGLWISREIIRRHGGQLELEDKPTPGASFRIELPIRRQQQAPQH